MATREEKAVWLRAVTHTIATYERELLDPTYSADDVAYMRAELEASRIELADAEALVVDED